MSANTKGKSPFYPGQPVPVELFIGRRDQIDRIMTRGVRQVLAGKPVSLFVQGEYGIGKSSIAGYVQFMAEREGLLPLYAPLGGAETIDDVGAKILEATVQAGGLNATRTDKLRNWLAKYIGEQNLFGVTLHADALKKDAPSIANGLLPFLSEVLARMTDTGVKGILLILDEINGITSNPKFAHWIKGLVDTNALNRNPLPLMLMLCGVEERRRDMIRHHQPIDRIFDVIDIETMNDDEMKQFFIKAFVSAGMRIDESALKELTRYSAGFPKIMHLLGDSVYWIDQDGIITLNDAFRGIVLAAEEVGKKYVDQQIYKALKSSDYRSILNKIAMMGPDAMQFKKADVAAGLNETEKRKFNNFLQKMKTLKVIRSGDSLGEYVFNMRMVRLYIWLQSSAKAKE